jgi:arabinofuranosyltransferase
MDRLREHAQWLLLGIAAIVLVAHSLAYNFVTDDAYISFVYSRNLAEHGQLTFNLGDPVEGYTNFLWTVVLGLLMIPGAPPEITSRVLGTACALVTLWLVVRIASRALGRRTAWAGVPALLLASSSGYACWSSGGLETQLFAMLVTGAIDAVVSATVDRRAIRRAGWLLALAAMTRPEGPMVAAVLGVAWLAHAALDRRERRVIARDELIAAAWFLGLWTPWFAWRWWYYGYPFPNTYYVKASGPWSDPAFASQMIDHGLYYVWSWLVQTRLVFVLPLVVLGLVARPRTPRFVAALALGLLAAAYVPYTVSVGGDFMGLHRFIMPLFVVAALLVTLGAERLTSLAPRDRLAPVAWLAVAGLALITTAALVELVQVLGGRHPLVGVAGAAVAVAVAFAVHAPRGVATIAGVALVVVFAITQLHLTRRSLDPKNLRADRGVIDTPAFLMVYTEDRAKIGRAMASCFLPDDFSIVGGAGAQPYYGRMRAIDVFGLVSSRIAHEEPRIRPRAGHTKWGSDRLLASYDPDFVFSCYRIHRTAAQPQLPCAGFWRGRGYELVTLHVPGLVEQGEYYTFLARKARELQCPGRVR